MHINTLTGAYFGSQQKNFTGKVFLKAIERFRSRLIVRISFGRSTSDASANTTDSILMPMFSYLLPNFRELQTDWIGQLSAEQITTCPLACQKQTENKTNIAMVLYW